MNNRLFCTILVVAICTMSIAHVAVAQETPFVITGYVTYANGTACDDPGVTVTTGTGKSWPAENYSVSNYYRLVLAKGTDFDVNATLKFRVTSPDGSQSKIVESSIAQVEIKEGGRFEYNISLALPSQQTWYFTDNTASAPIYDGADDDKIMTKGTEAGMDTAIGLPHGLRVWHYADPVADGDVTFPAGAWNVSYWVKTLSDEDSGRPVTTKLHGIDSTGAELPGSPYAEATYYINKAETVETVTASLNTVAFTIPAGGRLAIELIWDAAATSDLVLYCNLKGEHASQITSPTSDPSNLMPDLVIANQSVLWVDRTDQKFNVTYTVKNVGDGIASASKTNISVVNTNYDYSVPALSPDETHTSTVGPFDATFDESNHYYVAINICANYYKTVTESDETNNCATDGIGIPHLNISIESVDWMDELNKAYNISYEVLNSGGAASTNVTRARVYIDDNTNASATDEVGIMSKPPIDNPTSVCGTFGPFTMTGTSDTIKVCVEWEDGKNCVEDVFGYTATSVFDTGTGTYPGISGAHNGTLIPAEDIEVNRLYTYACAGTGGHTEYVRIWNETDNVDGQGNWSGYPGDYHNVTISPALTLLQGHTYNYTIETGSYPQIVHAKSKPVTGGNITCTEFTDTNGKDYENWIPAIRLFYDGG